MASISQAQPQSTVETGFWASFKKSIKDSRLPWLFILPSTLVMAFVTLYPQGYQVWMAFTNYDQEHFTPQNNPDYVGFDNFALVFEGLPLSNYDFFKLLAFNILWTVINVTIHVVLGVAIAMLINTEKLMFKRIYRSIFILGWATPQYIAALVWRNAFSKDFGAINLLAGEVNGILGTDFPEKTKWLTDETPPIDIPAVGWPLDIFEILPLSFYALLIANIWFGWPFMMIVATGALQSIPKELYEAADVDGASASSKFWSITVPLIRPAMLPAIMLGTIWTFNAFNVIFFITGGGPSRKTEILVTQSYNLLLETTIQGNFGMAAAFAIVVFLILFVITLLNNTITGATEAYYEA